MTYQPQYLSSTNSYIYGVLVLEDRKELVTSPGSSGKIQFWSLNDFRLLREINVSNYVWTICRLHKNYLGFGGGDQKSYVINIKKNTIEKTMTGHTAGTYGSFKIDKNLFATCSTDKTLRIWNWKKGKIHTTITHTHGVLSGLFLQKSNTLVFGGYSKDLGIYKYRGRKFIPKSPLVLDTANVWCMDIYDKRKGIIAIGTGTGIQLWNISKSRIVRKIVGPHSSLVYGIFCPPGTNLIISGGQDYHVSVFNAKKNLLVKRIRTQSYIYNVTISRKGRIFASNYSKKTCHFNTPHKWKGRIIGVDTLDSDSDSDDSDYSADEDSDGDDDDYSAMDRYEGPNNVDSDDDDDEEHDKKIKSEVQDFLLRFDFLMSGEMSDIEVTFKGGQIDFFKSFLVNSSRFEEDIKDEESIEIDEKISIDLEECVKLVFGTRKFLPQSSADDLKKNAEPFKIPEEKIFDYYVFFRELGMVSREYLVCRMIEHVKKIGVLLFLYKRCHERYEKGRKSSKKSGRKSSNMKKDGSNEASIQDKKQQSLINHYLQLDDEGDEEDEESEEEVEAEKPKKIFKTALCHAIMNQFKDREDEIIGRKKIFKIFQKEKLIVDIKDHVVSSLKKHKNFSVLKIEKKFPRSFRHAFKNDMKKAYKKGLNSTNITLKSSDGKYFPAHKEVLLLHFNFFQKMLQFSGLETTQFETSQEIELPYLNSQLVSELLNFVYLDKIHTSDLDVLFQLLSHAAMYFERKFQKRIVKRIRKYSAAEIRRDSIYRFLKKYLKEMNNNEVLKLVPFWAMVSDVNTNKLYRYLDKIKSDEKILTLNRRILGLEQIGTMIKDKMESFEKKITVLQHLYKSEKK